MSKTFYQVKIMRYTSEVEEQIHALSLPRSTVQVCEFDTGLDELHIWLESPTNMTIIDLEEVLRAQKLLKLVGEVYAYILTEERKL